MMYEVIIINDKEIKLCLPMRQTVELEKALGENPLNKLIEMSDGTKMPSFEFLATVFRYAMLKYQPKTDINKAYDIMDEYLEQEENDLTTLLTLIMKIFEVSGFFRNGAIKPTDK